MRFVGISTLQWVRKFQKKCPLCLHSHAYITPCPFVVPQRGKVIIFSIARTNTNVGPCCIMACGWFFRRTCFNYIPTLVYPLVLQLREYPLKPVTFTLCHFYLRNICPLFCSSQLSAFSAACFSASIQSPPDASLCGVVSNSTRTSIGGLKSIMTRSD